MQKCPNCGQPGMRTEDWACQWCGYPLLSRSYKKISKTFKQLKEEKLGMQKPPVSEVVELVAEPEATIEPEVVVEPEVAPEPEVMTEPEAVVEPEAAEEPEAVAKPKAVRKRKTAPRRKTAAEAEAAKKPKRASKRKAISEPEAVSEPESVTEPEVVAEAEPVSAPEAEPAAAEMEITVEELLSAYATEGTAADAKFANKILKVKGNVERVEIKEAFDIYYVNLTGAEHKLVQELRCVFNSTHIAELNQLAIGQVVTVQGKYGGSIIDIRMSDCALV